MKWRKLSVLGLLLLAACEDAPTTVRSEARLKAVTEPSKSLISSLGACPACAIGPLTLTIPSGASRITDDPSFPADPNADYLIVATVSKPKTFIEVRVNGVVVLRPQDFEGSNGAEISASVRLRSTNRMTVIVTGAAGGSGTVAVLGGAKKVGPGGGTIVAPGGKANLFIPPGALGVSTSIQMELDSTSTEHAMLVAAGGRGPTIRLSPDGLTFPVPLILRAKYPPGVVDAENPHLMYWSAPTGLLVWEPGSFDATAKEVVGYVSHFSAYQIRSWKIVAGQVDWQITRYPAQMIGTKREFEADLGRSFSQWNTFTKGYGVTIASSPTAQPSPNASLIEVGEIDASYVSTHPRVLGLTGLCVSTQGTSCQIPGIHRFIGFNSQTYKMRPLEQGLGTASDEMNPGMTALHEVGHALGLSHYLTSPCDSYVDTVASKVASCLQPPTMARLAVDYHNNHALKQLDLDGLTQLFQRANPNPPGFGPANALTMKAGNAQHAQIGTPVAILPSVLVTDAAGKPVQGVPVVFEVSGLLKLGSITGNVAITDVNGIAKVGSWTMSLLPVQHTLVARVDWLTPSAVTFVADADLTAPPPSTPTLLAYYPLDGNANDATSNPINGSINNATYVPGRVGSGSALQFSGGTSSMQAPIATGSKLALSSTDQFTVAMWVRADQIPTNSINAVVFAAGLNTFGWGPQIQAGGTALGNACTPSPGCFSAFGKSGGVTVGQWFHVAQVYDGATKSMTLYFNGVAGPTVSVSLPAATTDVRLSVGGPTGNAPAYAFVGSVDDVRIYRGILSQSDIDALANIPAPPPNVPTGHIAFMSVVSPGVEEIVTMNADGSQRTQITHRGVHSESPQYSLDGSQIAYQGDVSAGQNFEVHVANADGSNDHVVSPDPLADAQPSWSPSGTQIVFQSQRSVGSCAGQPNVYKIYIMDANGGNLRCLGYQGVQSETPSFSPNGQKIAYFVNLGVGSAEIWVMNVDGSNKVRLTSGAQDFYPRWSPNGNQILFERNGSLIVTMGANGGAVTTIAQGRYPAWSPTGTDVAFTALAGGIEQIFRVPSTGGQITRVSISTTRDILPSWAK